MTEKASTNLAVFLSNAGHGGVRGLVFMANTLVLVPLLLTKLGKEQFAILALVTPFLRYGFNGVFDFGLSAAVVRHTSRSFADSDSDDTNGYVSSSLVLYLVFGLILIALYYLLRPVLMSWLIHPDAALWGPAQALFERAVLIYVLFSLSNPFFALLIGIQKVKVTHWIGTGSLLIELFGTLLLLSGGVTLLRLTWVYTANAVFGLVSSAVFAKHYFKGLSVNWRQVSLRSLKEILFYGAQLSTTTFTAILSPLIDKLILARYVSLPAVAFYEGAARLIDLLRRATQLFLLPLLPIAGARENRHGEVEKRDFYVRTFSANLLVSSILYLIPASLAPQIFQAWLGAGSQLAARVFIVLSLISFSMALVGPLTMIFAGTGRLKPLMVTAVAGLFLNLTLSPALARYWGIQGVLCGAIVAYGVISWFFLLWTREIPEFDIPLGQLFSLCGLSIFAGLFPGIALTIFSWMGGQRQSRLKVLLLLAIAGGGFVTISMLQKANRAMLYLAFDHVRVRVAAGYGRRRLFNA